MPPVRIPYNSLIRDSAAYSLVGDASTDADAPGDADPSTDTDASTDGDEDSDVAGDAASGADAEGAIEPEAGSEGSGTGVGSGKMREGTPSTESTITRPKMPMTVRIHGRARRSSRVGSAPRYPGSGRG